MSEGNQDFRKTDAQIERDEAMAGGYIVLKQAEYERVMGMADALRRHPLAGSLFTRQLHEVGASSTVAAWLRSPACGATT
jgi:hypothetical protein